jgi:hypothetical protein
MLVIAAVAIFGFAWLLAEIKGRLVVRLAFGLACIGTLALALLSASWRSVLIEAEYRASMGLLGEALEKGDVKKATKAVAVYNERTGDELPVSRMLDALTAK